MVDRCPECGRELRYGARGTPYCEVCDAELFGYTKQEAAKYGIPQEVIDSNERRRVSKEKPKGSEKAKQSAIKSARR